MSWKDWFGRGKPESKQPDDISPSPAPVVPVSKKEDGFHSVEKQIFEQMGIPYRDILTLRDKLKINLTPQSIEEAWKKIDRFLDYEGFGFRVTYLEVFRSLLLHYQVNEKRTRNLLKPLSFYDVVLNRYCTEKLREMHEMDPVAEEVAELVADIVEEAAKTKATRLCRAETEHQLRKEYRVPRIEELKVSPEIFQERFNKIWKEYWQKKREKEGKKPYQQ